MAAGIQDGGQYLVDGVDVVSGCARDVDDHLVRATLCASVVHWVSDPRGVGGRWDNCVAKVTRQQVGSTYVQKYLTRAPKACSSNTY